MTRWSLFWNLLNTAAVALFAYDVWNGELDTLGKIVVTSWGIACLLHWWGDSYDNDR